MFYVLSKFRPAYNRMTPYSKDGKMRDMKVFKARPRTFDSIFGLALFLLHLCSKGRCNLLQMVFGSTKSQLSLWIRFSRRVLLGVLKSEPNAKVKMPTCPLKIQYYCYAIRNKYKKLGKRSVWCTTNELNDSFKIL